MDKFKPGPLDESLNTNVFQEIMKGARDHKREKTYEGRLAEFNQQIEQFSKMAEATNSPSALRELSGKLEDLHDKMMTETWMGTSFDLISEVARRCLDEVEKIKKRL